MNSAVPANAHAVLERHGDGMQRFVENRHTRLRLRAIERHRDRVSLDGTHGQLDSEPGDELRAVAAGGDHDSIGGPRLRGADDAYDSLAARLEARDGRVVTKAHASFGRVARERLAETKGIAVLVIGIVNGTRKVVHDRLECGLQRHGRLAIEYARLHAVLRQPFDHLQGRLQVAGLAKQAHRAYRACRIFEVDATAQLLQRLARNTAPGAR